MKSSIARAVLELFDKLPANGRPKEIEEFTVVAGIVAAIDGTDFKVLSLATGTKCIGNDICDHSGCIIHDSHAEVLARRGFIRYLDKALRNVLVDGTVATSASCPIERIDNDCDESSQSTLFKVKPNWSFHLYISDSPCGDASIYNVTTVGNLGASFTGAKLVQSENSNNSSGSNSSGAVKEMGEQVLGVVRTKSGRSDINAEKRTTSMCCSDKIARWMALGMQGPLLSLWLEPVYLSSIVVGRDPAAVSEASQLAALHRALIDRVKTVGLDVPLPSIAIVSEEEVQFVTGKSIMKYQLELEKQRKQAAHDAEVTASGEPVAKKVRKNYDIVRPCGNSINWISDTRPSATTGAGGNSVIKQKDRTVSCQGGSVEVTIAHTGALQGSTKKSSTAANQSSRESAAASRLSRRLLLDAWRETATASLYWPSNAGVVLELIKRCCEPQIADNSSSGISSSSSNSTIDSVDGGGSMVAAANRLIDIPYSMLKRQCSAQYCERRSIFLASEAFRDWLIDES